MDRRTFLKRTGLAASAMALANTVQGRAQGRAATSGRTRWIVRSSEGYDAISFLSPLSGEEFYLSYYEEEVAAFAPRLPNGTIATIQAMRAEVDNTFSPYLDLIFSNGHDADIPTLLSALVRRETALRPSLEASQYWSESSWNQFDGIADRLAGVLTALQNADFTGFRNDILAKGTLERIEEVRSLLPRYDVIAEQERYTGRAFDPDIEIVLLYFCRPHGIKVQGQQFLSSPNIPDNAIVRTAGHELLHPPVDLDGEAWKTAMAVLERDPLMARIVAEHDPKFGYNSLSGILNEDLSSAVDQIIAERLDVALPPDWRWTNVDGGMHVLSAALYGLMKRTGFAETGGDLDRWLWTVAYTGLLSPASLHGSASQVLGRPVDRLWPPPGETG